MRPFDSLAGAVPPARFTVKKTPPYLLALGKRSPPARIEVDGGEFELETVFKHDFFAYTGLYRGGERRVVLKMGRVASLFGLPLSWIGRLHAWHESTVFERVDDLQLVPRFTGRYGRHGITHEFVEGHELVRGEHVRDDFFDRLRDGLIEIHQRGVAYVDLEKPENVLVGDDGAPWLFDFQVSCAWPFRRGRGFPPFRWLLARLQQTDLYHVEKLRRRCRPDSMTFEEQMASRRRPSHVRYFTNVTRPLIHLRRRILNRVDPRKKRGHRKRLDEPGPTPTADARGLERD